MTKPSPRHRRWDRTSDGDGVPDTSDLCPNDFDGGNKDADGDGYGDACDNCRYVANGLSEDNQADVDGDLLGNACDSGIDNTIYDIPATPFEFGMSYDVTVRITNTSGSGIQTIKPDCYNTSWTIPGAKNLCRRGPGYGIPRDIVQIANNGYYELTCDINEMFQSVPTGVPRPR